MPALRPGLRGSPGTAWFKREKGGGGGGLGMRCGLYNFINFGLGGWGWGLLACCLQVRELGPQVEKLFVLLTHLDDVVQEGHAWPVGSGVVQFAKR